VHPDGGLDPERLDEPDHGLREPLPLDVRLGSVEEEERIPGDVADQVDRDDRGLELGPARGLERHGRAAAAVVDQLVDVERHHPPRAQRVPEVRGDEGARAPRVHHSLQRVDQHGDRFARAGVGVDPVQGIGVQHRGLLPRVVLTTTRLAPRPFRLEPIPARACPAPADLGA